MIDRDVDEAVRRPGEPAATERLTAEGGRRQHERRR